MQEMPPDLLDPQSAPQQLLLREAINDDGLYDAAKLAKYFSLKNDEIARYLKKSPSTVSRFGASPRHQERLAVLADLLKDLLLLMGRDLPAAKAWLRTPNRALEAAPLALIIDGRIGLVRNVLDEIKSGFAF